MDGTEMYYELGRGILDDIARHGRAEVRWFELMRVFDQPGDMIAFAEAHGLIGTAVLSSKSTVFKPKPKPKTETWRDRPALL